MCVSRSEECVVNGVESEGRRSERKREREQL